MPLHDDLGKRMKEYEKEETKDTRAKGISNRTLGIDCPSLAKRKHRSIVNVYREMISLKLL